MRKALLVVVLLLALPSLLAAAVSAEVAVRGAMPGAPAPAGGSLPWLHVAHRGGDTVHRCETGRYRLLRGSWPPA